MCADPLHLASLARSCVWALLFAPCVRSPRAITVHAVPSTSTAHVFVETWSVPDALARAPQLSPGCALPPALKQFCWRVCRQLKQLDSIPNDYKPSQLAQVRHSILAAERRNVVGYLRKGDSLSGMPLKFKSELASRCEQACRSKRSCKAYTFHPGQALCYLKSQVRPGLGGLRCTDDCWYFGVVSK